MITRYYMRADLAAVLYTRSNRDTRFTCRQCSRGLRRRCQSTTHRPLNCRCDCKRARTEHGSYAADMPGQYAVSRAPRSHTVHIRFSGPSNVHEICPRWTRRRLSWPEPDATRPRSRGLGRASTSARRVRRWPSRYRRGTVAVIGRAVVATHVRRTAATTSHEVPKWGPHLFRG